MDKLSKEKAIEWHRKMWNWIINRLINEPKLDVCELKILFFRIHKLDFITSSKNEEYDDPIENYCFCCEYAFHQANPDIYKPGFEKYLPGTTFTYCSHCPLLWGTENTVDEFYCERGMYSEYAYLISYEDNTTGLWQLIHYAEEIGLTPEEKIKIAKQIANLPERTHYESKNSD